MRPKKISFKTTLSHQKRRLDHVLAEVLPELMKKPVSKGKVRKLIVAGAVYLNRKRVRIASKELMPNAQIEVYIDEEKLFADEKQSDLPFEMAESHVLYEDEYLIAVNKPPGLPTQPTLDEARNNLFAATKKFLSQRTGVAIAQCYLGLHHRLDRDTSGVVLFTKSQEANPGIAEVFKSHLIQKTYSALTTARSGMAKDSWTVKNYLAKSKAGGKKSKIQSVRSGGDFAQTEFKILKRTPAGFWIEAQPKTGRTHQIRVHLSEQGLPILGDQTYGGVQELRQFKIPRLMLHALSLTLPHPIHKNELSIRSSLPEDFKKCLSILQEGGPVF